MLHFDIQFPCTVLDLLFRSAEYQELTKQTVSFFCSEAKLKEGGRKGTQDGPGPAIPQVARPSEELCPRDGHSHVAI